MNIKIILYCIIVPLSIWALNSINMNNIFKSFIDNCQNKII